MPTNTASRRSRLNTKMMRSSHNKMSAIISIILVGCVVPASAFLLPDWTNTKHPQLPIVCSPRRYHWLSLTVPSTTTISSSASNDEDEDEGIGVGIDLGTTHSAIAFLSPDTRLPTMIAIPENGRTMPSVVTMTSAHDDDDKEVHVLVGKEAIAKEAEQGSYRNVKRILGRGAKAAQDSLDVVPFLMTGGAGGDETKRKKGKQKYSKNKGRKQENLSQLIKDAEENPAMLYAVHTVNGHDDLPLSASAIPPAEISAHILKKLLETAEEDTGRKVTRVVIGVPAYFHDGQREATIEAANLAGISKVKLLREPEAAALAYGVGKQELLKAAANTKPSNENLDYDDELVLVFDLGGGTYDVSMLLVGGGLTEIITTSGDSQLGGSDFDAQVAQHLRKVLARHGLNAAKKNEKTAIRQDGDDTCSATDTIVRSAEMARIYLSNNKRVKMALPLDENSWSHMPHASDIILPLDYTLEDSDNQLTFEGTTNGTHVLCVLTRRDMEKLCQDEFLSLLRPIREVSIMAGALLPGDTSPTTVEAAMQMEEYDSLVFDDFYKEESASTGENEAVDQDTLLQLQDGLEEMSVKERKKAQQRGRKKARDVTKRERKYRAEKRKIAEETPAADTSDIKVRDGISGRPISRVVLVGGATRMPTIGRLLAALTGVVPQKTVNPDEAVALGCAVHVGVLDGQEDFGTVLNPMQAAILRAVAEQQQQQGLLPSDLMEGEDNDDDDFDTVEYF